MSALRACWNVAARGQTSLVLLCGGLALVERLAAIISAMWWGSRWFSAALTALLVCALANRGLRLLLRVRGTARAFLRVVDRAATSEDDLQGSTPMTVVEAVHHAVRAIVDLAVPLFANLVALTIGIVVLVDGAEFGFFVFGVLLAAGVTIVAGKKLTLSAGEAFGDYLGILDDIVDAFDGCVEIRASGVGRAYVETVARRIERWKNAAILVDLRGAIVNRVPIAIAGAALVLWLVAHGFERIALNHVLVLAALLPAGLGVVQTTLELARLPPRIAPLTKLLESNPTPTEGADFIEASEIVWENVGFRYGDRRVLSNVTFAARRGDVVCLTGPNGAGKTTLLLLAMRLRTPTHGAVVASGIPVEKLDRSRWRVAVRFLPQRPYLLPRRDIATAMTFPATRLDRETMGFALRRVHLMDHLETFPKEPLSVSTDSLSAGERQRLALARVLSRDGAVYFLDEPDANLDASGVRMVAGIVRELADSGKIVVVAAHTPELIAAADRVVHLENGRIISIEERSKGTPTSEKRRAAES